MARALRGVGIGAGDIGDQQPADRQPFLDIGKIIGYRGRNALLGQEPQQPQAGIIMVVPGIGARRKTTGNHMRPACRLCHRLPRSPFEAHTSTPA